MSWQAYVDDHLMVDLPAGGKLLSAAILGHDFEGDNHWAKSEGFPELTAAEFSKVFNAFDSPAATLAPTGLYVAGQKYTFIRCEDGAWVLGSHGKDLGVLMHKTTQAVIVALYNLAGEEPCQAGDVMNLVCNLAEYLNGMGF